MNEMLKYKKQSTSIKLLRRISEFVVVLQ